MCADFCPHPHAHPHIFLVCGTRSCTPGFAPAPACARAPAHAPTRTSLKIYPHLPICTKLGAPASVKKIFDWTFQWKKLKIRQIFILKLTSNVSIKVTEANINLKTVPFEIIVCQKKLYSVGCASLYSDSEGMLVWLQSSDHDGSYNWLILRRMANILNLFCIRHQSFVYARKLG